LNSDGSFNYTHDGSETTSDSFTYHANDGTADSNIATVTITINPINDPPVANDDYYTTAEETILNITAPGVLTNDTDPDDDPLTAVIITDVTNGTLTLHTNGSFTYTPDINFNGIDTFTYKANDTINESNTATVYITVTAVNDPPVANDDFIIVDEDSVNNQMDVLLNDVDIDTDELNITGVSTPSYGNVTYTPNYIFYTPNLNYNGPDQFNYTITDNNGGTDTAIVNITITPQNDAPYVPSNPAPHEGQTDVKVNEQLSWTGGDLDGDPVTYDVYFGITNPPPKVVSNQSITTFNPGSMNYSTKYYWRIVAWDNQSATTSGPIWNFTTEGEFDWESIITFEEPDGGYDDVYFGEKEASSDGQDSYDTPKSPAGIPPIIRAWFATNFPDPYDELWKEYKHSPDDYKIWNLSIQWNPSDYSSPTDITISWNSSHLNNSSYNNIFLKNNDTGEIINMFLEENYTFNASALILHNFQIICSNILEITQLKTKWNIVSVPFNQSVDKSDLIVSYDSVNYTWEEAVNNNIVLEFIYNWDRNDPQHYELTDILEPGYGFWIYSYQNCTLLAEGVSTKNNDGFITNMLLTWNIIGLPDIQPLVKEDLIVSYNGIDYNWTDATTNNNPTGEPIILGYIYNWSRSHPQHYELSDVFDPGYGYQIYAFYNCSLYYPIMGPLGGMPLGSRNDDLELSSIKDQTTQNMNLNLDTSWNAKLELNEPDGSYDSAFFGQKNVESENFDIFNIPKNPSGVNPYIRAWFATNFSTPYDQLWEEYAYYSDTYKVWNLTVQWIPSDYSSPTTITISWDSIFINNNEYYSLVLYDIDNNIEVADMLVDSNYTFTCPAFALQNYKIIYTTTTNQPPLIPSNPYPIDGGNSLDVDTILSWTGGDPDGDLVTYDVYFGKNNPPMKATNNQSITTYDPGKLDSLTSYYWRIVAWDNKGASILGPIWNFTTKESEVVDDIYKSEKNIQPNYNLINSGGNNV
jgi:VCBS repeat-containing protein